MDADTVVAASSGSVACWPTSRSTSRTSQWPLAAEMRCLPELIRQGFGHERHACHERSRIHRGVGGGREEHLAGNILIDIANPLDCSQACPRRCW